MRISFGSLLAVGAVLALATATFAARPSAPRDDSTAAVQSQVVDSVRDSLPSLAFHGADTVLSVRELLAADPLPATPAHEAALDSVVARSFVPVTFVARPSRSRIVIPLRHSRRDSIGSPQDDGVS